jgi:hypothetical protein
VYNFKSIKDRVAFFQKIHGVALLCVAGCLAKKIEKSNTLEQPALNFNRGKLLKHARPYINFCPRKGGYYSAPKRNYF